MSTRLFSRGNVFFIGYKLHTKKKKSNVYGRARLKRGDRGTNINHSVHESTFAC